MKRLLIILALLLLAGCMDPPNPYRPGTVQSEQYETRMQLNRMQRQRQDQYWETQQQLDNMRFDREMDSIYQNLNSRY